MFFSRITFRETNFEHGVVLYVQGDIDMHSGPQLRARLGKIMKRRCPAVVLDLSGVLFIDSTGIAVLIEYLREASASGSQFVIAGLTEHVDHVFNIVRLDKAVPVFRTAVEAVRTLGNGGAPAPPEPLFTMVKAGHSAAGPTLVSA